LKYKDDKIICYKKLERALVRLPQSLSANEPLDLQSVIF